jgi:hypothetical protein
MSDGPDECDRSLGLTEPRRARWPATSPCPYRDLRLETAYRRAYTGAVTDPTSPEIIAWLEILPIRERAVTLHAMAMAIPSLQRSPLEGAYRRRARCARSYRRAARRHIDGGSQPGQTTKGRAGRLIG